MRKAYSVCRAGQCNNIFFETRSEASEFLDLHSGNIAFDSIYEHEIYETVEEYILRNKLQLVDSTLVKLTKFEKKVLGLPSE